MPKTVSWPEVSCLIKHEDHQGKCSGKAFGWLTGNCKDFDQGDFGANLGFQ